MLTTSLAALTVGTLALSTGPSSDEGFSCRPLSGATAQHLLCRLDRTDMFTFRPTFVDPGSVQACLAEQNLLTKRVAMAGHTAAPTTVMPVTAAKSTFGVNSVVTLGVMACTNRPF